MKARIWSEPIGERSPEHYWPTFSYRQWMFLSAKKEGKKQYWMTAYTYDDLVRTVKQNPYGWDIQ